MPQRNKDHRPSPKTMVRVIEYLNSIDLHVYGPNCDLRTGEVYPSLRDYSGMDAVKYRKLFEKDELWVRQEGL